MIDYCDKILGNGFMCSEGGRQMWDPSETLLKLTTVGLHEDKL